MPQKRRKLSDLTREDTNSLLLKLEEFRSSLDDGDEDLPVGLIEQLQELRDKLEDVKHTSFSNINPLTLVSMKISSGPLFLANARKEELELLGSTEFDGCLSMNTTRSIILLTEAGRRMLINTILLRVASVMSLSEISVNIIPEYPIPRTTFTSQDSHNLSFSGVVDFLMTRLPSPYTGVWVYVVHKIGARLPAEYLLKDPITALANPTFIEGPLTSTVFEAKRENVRTALPQAVIASASYCRQQRVPVMRGCVTSGEEWIFFVYETTSDGGGTVRSSREYQLGPQLEGLALVVGILQDWINNAAQSTHRFFKFSPLIKKM